MASKRKSEIFNNKTIKRIKSIDDKTLNNIIKNLSEFEIYVNESENIIQNHCESLRYEVDVSFESVMEQIFKHKQNMLNKINNYEKGCLKKIESNINEANDFIKLSKDILNNSKNKSDDDIFQLSMDCIEIKNEFKSVIFQENNFKFKFNEEKIDESIIGYIEECSTKPKIEFDYNKFFTQPVVPLFHRHLPIKNIYNRSNIIPLGYDRIVLCSNVENNIYEIILLTKTGIIINKQTICGEFIKFCSNMNYLFVLARIGCCKVLHKYDKNLIMIKFQALDVNVLDIACNDKIIFYRVPSKCICELPNDYGYNEIRCIDIVTLKHHNACDGHDKCVLQPEDCNHHEAYNMFDNEVDMQFKEDVLYYSVCDRTMIYMLSKSPSCHREYLLINDRISASDVYLFRSPHNKQLICLYKFNNKFSLCDKNGSILERVEMNMWKQNDKYCITNDGCLVIINEKMEIEVY